MVKMWVWFMSECVCVWPHKTKITRALQTAFVCSVCQRCQRMYKLLFGTRGVYATSTYILSSLSTHLMFHLVVSSREYRFFANSINQEVEQLKLNK